MRMPSFSVAVCAACLYGLMTSAAAQPLTDLGSLMGEAIAKHPDIRSSRGNAVAADFELQGAQWGRYPSLSTELQTQRGGPQAVLRLEQPLWTGGRITGQIELASAGLAEAEAAVTEAEQLVLTQTASAYFEILRLESRLAVAKDSVREHGRLVEVIQRRVSAQVSPATDETQATARLNQAINEQIQTERQLDATRIALEQVVGRPVGAIATPTRVGIGSWKEATLLEAALSFSPERRRLQAQVAVADAQVELAQSRLKPSVVLGYQARLGHLQFGEERGRAYVALQMQTGAGFSSLSGVDAAIARRQAALDSIEALERTLSQQVRSVWAERQSVQQQIEPVRALLGGADEIVASYLRQFQVGRKNWLDVLNALREKTQAQYSLADLESPLMFTEVRLRLLAGLLNAQNLTPHHAP